MQISGCNISSHVLNCISCTGFNTPKIYQFHHLSFTVFGMFDVILSELKFRAYRAETNNVCEEFQPFATNQAEKFSTCFQFSFLNSLFGTQKICDPRSPPTLVRYLIAPCLNQQMSNEKYLSTSFLLETGVAVHFCSNLQRYHQYYEQEGGTLTPTILWYKG